MNRRSEIGRPARSNTETDTGTTRRAIGRSRRRLTQMLVCLTTALSALALTPGPTSAAVSVTDAPNFAVSIDGNETVSVGCTTGGKVVVTVDGVATTHNTNCADVTSLAVTATGTFQNDISLSSVDATSFSALGSPTLDGGGGNDVLQGSGMGDSISGGPGVDTVSFREAPGPVTANLSRQTATGEGSDTLVDLENIQGSDFSDTLTGNGLANSLFGFDGDDLLSGGGADDFLDGGAGVDVLKGQGGMDTCVFGERVRGC